VSGRRPMAAAMADDAHATTTDLTEAAIRAGSAFAAR